MVRRIDIILYRVIENDVIMFRIFQLRNHGVFLYFDTSVLQVDSPDSIHEVLVVSQ